MNLFNCSYIILTFIFTIQFYAQGSRADVECKASCSRAGLRIIANGEQLGRPGSDMGEASNACYRLGGDRLDYGYNIADECNGQGLLCYRDENIGSVAYGRASDKGGRGHYSTEHLAWSNAVDACYRNFHAINCAPGGFVYNYTSHPDVKVKQIYCKEI